MKGLMNKMMLSCVKATEMVEKKKLFGLTWKENMQLKAHNAMCKVCKEYEMQSEIIDSVLKHYLQRDNIIPLNNEKLKLKIISKLK